MTLEVRGLGVTFGGNKALDDFDLVVPPGAVFGLIGPNGAGKSTAVNAMTGILRAVAGSVKVKGKEVFGLPPAKILHAGMARTFQQAQLWAGMTVQQNLTVPLLSAGRRAADRRAEEVAEMFHITHLLQEPATLLPYGARRLVEVSRAMMTKPCIVMLDEPGAGLTPSEKTELRKALAALAATDCSVLLIDHDMELVMTACSSLTVLDAGRLLAVGTPEEVRSNQRVIDAYLGVGL